MSTPIKRKVKQLQAISPNKCTKTRRPVNLFAAIIGDETTAVLMPRIPGRDDLEVYTQYAKNEILNDEQSRLKNEGIIMVVALPQTSENNATKMSTKGYAFKGYIVSTDESLVSDDFSLLRKKAEFFKDVSADVPPCE